MYSNEQLSWRQGAVATRVPFSVLDEERPGVLLTPECDLQQAKAITVLFVALFEATELIMELVSSDWVGLGLFQDGEFMTSASNGKRRQLDDRMKQMQRNQFQRYHWLDAFPGVNGPLIADFQFISCLPSEFLRTIAPAAMLADPYRSELPARYAAYAGRIGTPDPEEARLATWRQGLLDANFPLIET